MLLQLWPSVTQYTYTHKRRRPMLLWIMEALVAMCHMGVTCQSIGLYGSQQQQRTLSVGATFIEFSPPSISSTWYIPLDKGWLMKTVRRVEGRSIWRTRPDIFCVCVCVCVCVCLWLCGWGLYNLWIMRAIAFVCLLKKEWGEECVYRTWQSV